MLMFRCIHIILISAYVVFEVHLGYIWIMISAITFMCPRLYCQPEVIVVAWA